MDAGTKATDRQLVEQALAGDGAAFATLHRRYYARIYRLAMLRCQNASDAEDIAAETFVRAVTHLHTFRFQGESLFPWLSRICANLIADWGRHRAPAPVVSLDTPTAEGLSSLLEGMMGNGPDPHAIAVQHETQQMVRAAIAALPPDQADAVVLRFLGDLSLKEIAAALGKTEGAVKSLLHRALASLRKSLQETIRGADAVRHMRQQSAETKTQAYGSQYVASDESGPRRTP